MTRLAHSRLCNDLLVLSKDFYLEPKDGGKILSEKDRLLLIISALSNAWQIIDSMNRFRNLLCKMPGLKRNTPDLQLFYRRTLNLKYFRNSIQHLDEHILSQYIKDKIPALGTLNWVATLDESGDLLLFALAAGKISGTWTPLINPLKKHIKIPISTVTLCLAQNICISDLVEKYLKDIIPYLQASLHTNIGNLAGAPIVLIMGTFTPRLPESP